MPPSVAEATLSARSLHDAPADWFDPSDVTVLLTCGSTGPERESEQFHVTVTLVLFQPKAFAAGKRVANDITGLVLSMLIPPTVSGLAVLPALSVQAPVLVKDCPAPSPLRVPPPMALAPMPERVSAQLKKTDTSVLFQPFAFATGLRLPSITGAVVSMLMPPTVAETATFPALSTQSPVLVTDWLAPSVARVFPATL